MIKILTILMFLFLALPVNSAKAVSSSVPQQKVTAYTNPDLGRYQIITTAHSPTILLDTVTGLTWRNTYCNNEAGSGDKVLGCWQIMIFDITPVKMQDALKLKN